MCKASEEVVQHPTENLHSLPSKSSLAPAVPSVISCAMQDRFCHGAAAFNYETERSLAFEEPLGSSD